MSKKNIDHSVESRVCFEQLEEWVREQIQFYVQELLEDEVTQLLGRRKNERRREVDASGGYRNGYGKERRLTMSCGTIKLRRPRVRDLEERFESRVLPLFAKRTREVRDLIPELYLHGLAEGDFDLALRGLLGEEAPLSPSTVARLWQGEMEAWHRRLGSYLKPPDLPYRRVAISPEGDRFLLLNAGGGSDETAQTTSIHVVLNWFEELKERVPLP